MRTFSQYKLKALIILPALMAGCFLIIRIKYAQSLFLSFLIWNLFLAYVPLFLSNMIVSLNLNKIRLWICFVIWLLFLPNSPYIFTDYKHLFFSHHLLYFDIIMVGCFAFSGFIAGLYSMFQIHMHLKGSQSFKWIWGGISIISFACGLGIYLGREVRFNSWDIISKPLSIISTVIKILLHPFENRLAWSLIVGFGVFILISYVLLYVLIQPSRE